jgi:DNA repair exonuclease SbcCD ATPase subunit
LLDKIPNLSGVERAAALERAEKRLKSAQGTKRSFKMETRLVQDPNQRRKYESRLNELQNELQSLSADTKALRTEEARGQLFVGGRGNGVEEFADEEGDVKAGDSLLNQASQIQDKTQDSLSNTKQMIAQSKEVGSATLEELERQREVLNNIDRETDRINDNLSRAEALVKQFGKRMATDKFIQCFAVVNCLLLLAVILYAVLKGGKLGGNNSSPKTPALRY